jgi:hypothetical protein
MKSYESEEDRQTELNFARRMKRLDRRRLWKEQYHDKNGEVVKYVPTPDGIVVMARGEMLGLLHDR